MRIRFWGTRGSIPKAGHTTVRYGGNTSCVEVRSASGAVVIFDCGTGAHGLGESLVEGDTPVSLGHILITHTHWDHIQGLPFFGPLFQADHEWHIYGPRGIGVSLRDTLAGQMQHRYFPVGIDQLDATIHFHELVEGTFDLGDIRVVTSYLNHTALTLGYRLEADGVTVVYATDHEPHSRALADGATGPLNGGDRRHADFLAGADLVIHDAQYRAQEYPHKVGWGHSTMEYVVDLSHGAGVRSLALFHHDPLRTDEALDALVQESRARAAGRGGSLEVFAAAEGQVIDLQPATAEPTAGQAEERMVPSLSSALRDREMLVALDASPEAAAIEEALRAEPHSVRFVKTGDEVLAHIKSELPSLIVLGRQVGGQDGLALARTIRRGHGAAQTVPIILVVSGGADTTSEARPDEAVTDWLVAPFSSRYAGVRIRACLLGTPCRWSLPPTPDDEQQRLRVLRDLAVLDTEPEERFDRLTRLAAALFNVPIALVSLIDADRQWFKSGVGLETRETPRELSFCAHAIATKDLLVVPDALVDPRFAENPLVTGEPHIRFYAGVPLLSKQGTALGSLCLIDNRPRELSDEARSLLCDLGELVQRELTVTRLA